MPEFVWQAKWQAIAPKPFAIFSILGSVCIMKYVLSSDKRRGSIYHRLLLGLSVYDFLSSSFLFVGTWAIPKNSSGVYMASGTQGTCSAQGFFIQLVFNIFSEILYILTNRRLTKGAFFSTQGVGAPLYNASLTCYYFFIIWLGWDDAKMRKVEVWLHVMPNVIAIGTSIAGAALLDTEGHRGLYHNSNLWCWIAPPANPAYRLGFFYGLVWACIAFATFAMCAIYHHVWKTEQRTRRYSSSRRASLSNSSATMVHDTKSGLRRTASSIVSRSSTSTSSKIASQATLYLASFYVAFFFASWTRLSQMITGSVPNSIICLFAIFFPLQGFFNAMIFFRPLLIQLREKNPGMSLWQIVRANPNISPTNHAKNNVDYAQRNYNDGYDDDQSRRRSSRRVSFHFKEDPMDNMKGLEGEEEKEEEGE